MLPLFQLFYSTFFKMPDRFARKITVFCCFFLYAGGGGRSGFLEREGLSRYAGEYNFFCEVIWEKREYGVFACQNFQKIRFGNEKHVCLLSGEWRGPNGSHVLKDM